MSHKKTKKSTIDIHPPRTVAQLREAWLDYFKSKGHTHVPSSSLIPQGDPTLLFTTAGMVQFKPCFAGTEDPGYHRAVTIQKCFRTTDLESVGKTARHLTMFEMLGNFSFFNDYFKEEAIQFSWEFSLERLQFEPEKIHVTIYQDDDEAEEIWHKTIGIPKERITRLGKEDNWWGPAGDSGACGPCSELYLDRGVEHCSCDDKEKCHPGNGCDRYLEYWNLVFNQYYQDPTGKLHPLPHKGIDTGAGLERIVAILNNNDSVYDTDELVSIIGEIEALTGELREDRRIVRYKIEHTIPFRVIADHARSVVFAIADGIQPDNTGRGYVVRRIIRRALLFARELGIQSPVLYRLVPHISETYAKYYPEVGANFEAVVRRIRAEEERFLHTLDHGLRIWEEYLSEHRARKARIFDGAKAFRLYDTFGFPLEMTVELAERESMEVDLEEFQRQMERQRLAASRASSFKEFNLPDNVSFDISSSTEFTGYQSNETHTRIISLIKDDREVKSIAAGENAIVILERTPFYAEGGGQQGDTGSLKSRSGALFLVNDTRKKGGIHLHIGELTSGSLQSGDTVIASIDTGRRDLLTHNHSATHLLNAALRKYLGDHVIQTGSLVSPDYLRFDFSHGERIDTETLEKVETHVNQAITANASVKAQVMPIEDARKTGAVATFGEKYGQQVRVVIMGEKGDLSTEFCGGCHVSRTGEIALFHILKESSPGAGNRRIEAITGDRVLAYFRSELEKLQNRHRELSDRIHSISDLDEGAEKKILPPLQLPSGHEMEEKLQKERNPALIARSFEAATSMMVRAEKELNKQIKKSKESTPDSLLEQVAEMEKSALDLGALKCFVSTFDSADIKVLRILADTLKEKHRSALILFGAKSEKGPLLLFMTNTGGLKLGIHCGKLIQDASAMIGGGGGGRPDMAQAGGKDASRLGNALESTIDAVKKMIN